MSKYVLSPDGSILKKVKSGENDNIDYDFVFQKAKENEYIQNINKNYQKPSEDLISFPFTVEAINLFEDNEEKLGLNKYVIGKTDILRNDSFGFVDENIAQPKNSNRKINFYKDYNSVFDLDENENNTGLQIFASDLDFYGFSPELLTDIETFGEEIILRLMTTIDILIAAIIPVLTMSTLQSLIQANQKNEINLQLGKYINYSYTNSSEGNIGIIILEKILNSFERLMNYPKFKSNISILDIINDIGYFIIGYSMYISPGVKVKLPTQLTLSSIGSFLLNYTTQILSSNSIRHQYNLLIRKIARNNYFLKQYLNSDSRQNNDSFIKSLSYLGSYFFRFIGERISVGEKVYKSDNSSLYNKKSFGVTRLSEIQNLEIERKNIDIKDNANITSFRSNINPVEYEESVAKGEKNYMISFDHLKIWKEMNQNTNKLYNIDNINQDLSNIKRLKTDDVTRIEQMIDSDYMPFSIHDIRTNEVFRFHAFIENVTDSFSPEFTTSTGFGRMDPVKIYNSTQRSMSVDFWLISTSREDHDEMWYYINRLVSCLYPQWSKPILANIVDKNNSIIPFSRPFTQIPIASPLIRLRIGDIIKSNYNRETVSREIFEIDFKNNNKDELQKYNIEKIFLDIISFLYFDNIQYDRVKEIQRFQYKLDSKFNEIKETKYEDSITKQKYYELTQYKIIDPAEDRKKYLNLKFKILENTFIEHDVELTNDIPESVKEYLDKILELQNDKSLKNSNENKFMFEQTFIYEDINSTISSDSSGSNVKSNVQRIIRPNAIVSSYESTKGEGVAGFIKNLNVDIQNSNWDIQLGNIAPQMVKLSMQFDPIHDIPLGLNYKGGMRAAAYSIGSKNDEYFKRNE